MAKSPVTTKDLEVVDGAAAESAPTASESRDETHDSIDPATGALTAEAVAKRAEMAAALEQNADFKAGEETTAG